MAKDVVGSGRGLISDDLITFLAKLRETMRNIRVGDEFPNVNLPSTR
jgi:hypothetical protein